jgi:hypothetical protein
MQAVTPTACLSLHVVLKGPMVITSTCFLIFLNEKRKFFNLHVSYRYLWFGVAGSGMRIFQIFSTSWILKPSPTGWPLQQLVVSYLSYVSYTLVYYKPESDEVRMGGERSSYIFRHVYLMYLYSTVEVPQYWKSPHITNTGSSSCDPWSIRMSNSSCSSTPCRIDQAPSIQAYELTHAWSQPT